MSVVRGCIVGGRVFFCDCNCDVNCFSGCLGFCFFFRKKKFEKSYNETTDSDYFCFFFPLTWLDALTNGLKKNSIPFFFFWLVIDICFHGKD